MSDDPESAEPQVLVTSEPFAALRPQWEALYRAVPNAVPFQHPAFLDAWLRHFDPGGEPVLLAFRRDEELVGVAALSMDSVSATWAGDANVCDYAGPLALPGAEEAVADTLFEFFNADMTSRATLWGLREGDPMRPALAATAEGHGWAVMEEDEAVSPGILLPDSWERYLAGLPKHDRHELQRKLRRLEAAGTISFESYGEPAQIAARFDHLLALMAASHQDKAAFLAPPMAAFLRDIAVGLAEAGLARLGVLTLDSAPVAMLLTFEDEAAVYLYNSGYDPEHAHLAVGLLSKALCLKDAIARGKRRFDFLRGQEEYKRHLGGLPERIIRLSLHR